jgi:multidrug efflux pump subunit AcrA (membrane-fusion protein)
MQLPRFCLRSKQTIIFLIAVLLSAVNNGCSEKNEYVEPPAPEVTVSKPLVQNVTDYLEFTGTTKSIEEIEIRARVEGFLEGVHFEDGDFVTKDQLLFTIDNRPFKAAVEQAKGRLAKHKAQLERAEKEYERNLSLFKQNAASEANVVKWKSDMEESRGTVISSQAALDNAQLNLSYCTIRSPISGRISRKQVDVGNLVGASEHTLLTTIRQQTPIYVYFSMNERDLLRIMEKSRAEGITADKPEDWPMKPVSPIKAIWILSIQRLIREQVPCSCEVFSRIPALPIIWCRACSSGFACPSPSAKTHCW